jgi:hypothetical protein
VDARLIVADANKQRSMPGPRWNKEFDAEAASRATKEYLATLDDAAFGAASDVRDAVLPGQDTRLPQPPPQVAVLSERRCADSSAASMRKRVT